jgi:hypothetical protein
MAIDDQMIDVEQAANILRMSQHSFVKLLETGAVPYHGSLDQRCVYVGDVLSYAQRRDKERHAALDRLSRTAVKAGLYDHNVFPEGGHDE